MKERTYESVESAKIMTSDINPRLVEDMGGSEVTAITNFLIVIINLKV